MVAWPSIRHVLVRHRIVRFVRHRACIPLEKAAKSKLGVK